MIIPFLLAIKSNVTVSYLFVVTQAARSLDKKARSRSVPLRSLLRVKSMFGSFNVLFYVFIIRVSVSNPFLSFLLQTNAIFFFVHQVMGEKKKFDLGKNIC